MIDERKQERIFEQIRKEDYEEAYQEAYEEGFRLGRVKALKGLMKTQHISLEEAMKAIGIPLSERDDYAQRIGVLRIWGHMGIDANGCLVPIKDR